MAVTAYKGGGTYAAVAESALQTLLAAELVAGRWMVDGGEGFHYAKDRGFQALDSAPAVTGSRTFSIATWANSARTPTSVTTHLAVAAADLQAVLTAEALLGAELHALLYEFDAYGKAQYDLVFYVFA